MNKESKKLPSPRREENLIFCLFVKDCLVVCERDFRICKVLIMEEGTTCGFFRNSMDLGYIPLGGNLESCRLLLCTYILIGKYIGSLTVLGCEFERSLKAAYQTCEL